jgi:hypothetical protein
MKRTVLVLAAAIPLLGIPAFPGTARADCSPNHQIQRYRHFDRVLHLDGNKRVLTEIPLTNWKDGHNITICEDRLVNTTINEVVNYENASVGNELACTPAQFQNMAEYMISVMRDYIKINYGSLDRIRDKLHVYHTICAFDGLYQQSIFEERYKAIETEGPRDLVLELESFVFIYLKSENRKFKDLYEDKLLPQYYHRREYEPISDEKMVEDRQAVNEFGEWRHAQFKADAEYWMTHPWLDYRWWLLGGSLLAYGLYRKRRSLLSSKEQRQ